MHVASSVAGTTLAVPPTQNTAPVLEFNCLYTHDIRRKSKRWQDGFLRFHTFNKRVMVYDVMRNFVGDAHWRESDLLQDGDEVKLDKNGVLVQVADQIGRTETDLTDLRKSKNKPTTNPASSSPLRLSSAITIVNPTHPERWPLQSKHRSLNALLGPSRAPIGKAVLPSKSPYEIRKEHAYGGKDDEWAQQGKAKRQRVGDTTAPGKGNALFSAKAHAARHDLTPVTNTGQANADRTAQSPSSQTRDPSASEKCRKEVVEIDLRSDDDRSDIFSSMLPDPSAPTPSRSGMPPPKLSSAARRQAETSTIGKRLSLPKTAPKRNMLACHSMISDSVEARFQDAQKNKLQARLARLQERKNLRADQRQNTNQNPSIVESPSRPKPAAAPNEILIDPPARRLEAAHEDVNDIMSKESTDDASELEMLIQHHDHTTMAADLVAAQSIAAPTESYDLAQDEIEALDDMLIPDDDLEAEAELADINIEIETEEEVKDDNTVVETVDAQQIESMVKDTAAVPEPPILAVDSTMSYGQCDTLSGEDLDLHSSNGASAVGDGTQAVDLPQEQQRLPVPSKDPPCQPIVEEWISVPAGDATAEQTKPSDVAQQQPFAPRRRKGVSRLDVRKSASSCFKPPILASRDLTASASKPAALGRQTSGGIASTAGSGPWSREAFDLFAWRPPDWDENSWSLKT
ncbi:hypothetical protein AMS68_005500 [Peltaster fructicola]|uniref:5'-3' DNA helicase ZGRF1-like N-terminal domain-containing protein n=1 Tax=Peltaster fructicola TaxID=286661 RepID=A0A6H0XYZ7_9PEZI|nr:hypothetical protein AMS68_005500 [Peltaster fructicola]